MKKIKMGTVEILGFIGIAVWVAVILLRENPLSSSYAYWFVLGILPNLGAAWAFVMFAKWAVIFGLKREITPKSYLLICVVVLALALVSEVIHDLFQNSPFDVYDILITVVALLIAYFLPILTKDRYFSRYGSN